MDSDNRHAIDPLDLLQKARDRIDGIRQKPDWGFVKDPLDLPSVTEWLGKIADVDGVAYFFDFNQLDHFWNHFSYTPEQWAAELSLAERAERWADLGLYLAGTGLGIRSPIYRRYRQPVPWTKVGGLSDSTDQATLKSAEGEFAAHQLPDVYARSAAAAGTLLSCPGFLRERDRLRELWRQLPKQVRPVLPLYFPQLIYNVHFSRNAIANANPDVSPGVSPGVNAGISADDGRALSAFVAELQPFAALWRLRGLLTWDLPDPLDLRLIEDADDDALDYASTAHTRLSPLIPIPLSDARFSKNMLQRHEDWRLERGLSLTTRRWSMMANLAQIRFLECAIAGRLKATNTPDLRPTEYLGLLADVLGIDEGNIRKCLREQSQALRPTGVSPSQQPVIGMSS